MENNPYQYIEKALATGSHVNLREVINNPAIIFNHIKT